MPTIIDWTTGGHLNFLKMLDATNSLGPNNDTILHLGNFERRFQAIKHGSVGESKILVEVSDDSRVHINLNVVIWLPLALFTINSDAATVNFDGTIVTNPGPGLICGFVSKAGWKYVRSNLYEHSGDPVTLILGV